MIFKRIRIIVRIGVFHFLKTLLANYFLRIFFFLLGIYSTSAQEYGIRFSGAQFSKDQRTGIDLNPSGYFNFRDEFELSFKLSFCPKMDRYFGYITRIIDEDNKNLDIIFYYRGLNNTSIGVIYREKLTNIHIKTDLENFCTDWKELVLKFDLKNHKLIFNFRDTTITATDISLNGRIKVLFGANEFEHFKTTDVPPMNIKDIKILEKGKIMHSWPLDEIEGASAADIINTKRAIVKNPNWIKPFYQNWKNNYKDTINGPAFTAFNERDEEIYFIGDEQLRIYSMIKNKVKILEYKNKPSSFIQGCRAFFDTSQNILVCYNIKQRNISVLDFQTLEWKEFKSGSSFPTVLWHHNKYFSAKDSALYILGGYGQYEYKNIVQRYSFRQNKWDTLKITGDTYYPRYLASLGVRKDTLFLLGGYGSISGNQIENPQSFYDLNAFSVKEKKIIKIYNFRAPVEDAAFANSMIIDKDSSVFYALTFPVLKYESYLQLIKGSLVKPQFELVGEIIPYYFQDETSFADLFYSRSNKKIVALTLLYNKNDNKTKASVFTIAYPPNTISAKDVIRQSFPIKVKYLFLSMIIFSGFITGFWFYRRLKVNRRNQAQQVLVELFTEEAQAEVEEEKLTYKNTILFFGEFQIYNRNSVDITNKFSPLLKEIFLLIWLNSLQDHIGVSIEKLTELFWVDKENKSAINNRAVNIAKLKYLLEEIDSCNLTRGTGYWKIVFDDHIIYNDYVVCHKVMSLKKNISKNQIMDVINITSKGPFLENLNYEWLDEFKDNITNSIIDTLVTYGLSFDVKNDPDLILNLANAVFKFDIVNEEAMILKCKALIASGKHSIAKNTYSKFLKDYYALYSISYEKSYSVITK